MSEYRVKGKYVVIGAMCILVPMVYAVVVGPSIDDSYWVEFRKKNKLAEYEYYEEETTPDTSSDTKK